MKKINNVYIIAIILGLITTALILIPKYINYDYKELTPERKKEISEQEEIIRMLDKFNEERGIALKNSKLLGCVNNVNERFEENYENRQKTISYEEAIIIIQSAQKEKDECFGKYEYK